MDTNLLFDLLAKHNPSVKPPSLALLDKIFTEFENIRIPHTADLVKRARAQGDTHVVIGLDALLARNNTYRDWCQDPNGPSKRFGI